MARSATVISATRSPDAKPLVAADVGGTHARIALMRAETPGKVAMLDFRQYACADFPDLSDIVAQFLRDSGAREADRAVIAIAGVLHGDALVNTNLPWPVSLSRMRHALSLRDLQLVNDFEAMAYATPYIDPVESVRLTGPATSPARGATLVIGPGTGLGAALWTPSRGAGVPPQVLATEAGHAALAPGNERELAIVGHFLTRWPHVDNERALSGPGLLNLYRCLCELDAAVPALASPAEVAQAAQNGTDAQAGEALRIFCAMLGSLIGDLVLTFGAQAVYLAGGMPAHIKPFLLRSRFVERYLNKGVLRSVLEQVPVSVIDHGRYGLLGAAAWYLDRGENE